jgi:O-succinylbenzoic acid--CoA ligase
MSNAGPWIELRGTRIPIHELADIEKGALSENEKKAVEFCIDFLNGRKSFVITTSGSTGVPKNIQVSSDAMTTSARRTAKALGLIPGMTSLVCLDAGFIAGMMMLVRSLTTGMNMIITEPSANPLNAIPPSKIDFVALVPYQLSTILGSDQHQDLPNIGTIILGGASVTTGLLDAIQNIGTPCYATFGMTETLSHIALQRLNGASRQENFHTLDGVTITADDRGCLVIDVDYLDSRIVTNDLVEIVTSKEFKWIGRYDNVINSGGIKIVSEKIEKAVGDWMLTNGLSKRFFVTGVAHPQLGEEVTLVVEGTFPGEDEHALLSSLKTVLLKYEVPRRIFYKSHFVETKTGKIDRKLSLL